MYPSTIVVIIHKKMYARKINFDKFNILYWILDFIVYTAANHTCCPDGRVVLAENNVCWNLSTNVTSPINLKCNQPYRINKKYYTITEDEQISFSLGNDIVVEIDVYCISNFIEKQDVTFLNNVTEAALVCNDDAEEDVWNDRLLAYCTIVSVLFLIPTALIYTALPELRDVQGKSIINFCISLAIGQGILVILKLAEYSDMDLCAARGFLTYFFIIAAFFWTNAISIQVLINTIRPAALDYSWHEFKWYFLYSWGSPAVLTVCMAIVNFHPGKHHKPGIGLNYCWFFNRTQQWYYMYSVMSLLLAANIAIFIYISLVIWRLSSSSSHLKTLKYKFVLSVRLILLMGLPWVFEMIESLCGKHIIWRIIDVFNSMQGLLIFLLLVVLRKRVIKLMLKKGWLACISGFVEKHLALKDDEENVVQHTDIPMSMSNRNTNEDGL